MCHCRFCAFILFIALCVFKVNAQNNDFKINDDLYQYFKKVNNNLTQRDLGLQMTDTLFVRSQKAHDLKAQCIALYLRVHYYHLQKDDDRALVEFKRVAPFMIRTPYTQYYFGAWSSIIIGYLNLGRRNEAIRELGLMQDKALAMHEIG